MNKGGLDGFKLLYEVVNGDRGKRWKIKKLKRHPVHYVYGRRVAMRKFGTRTVYRALEWVDKNLRRFSR